MNIPLPEHFDEFSEARKQGFMRILELKKQGKNICGSFCQYTPEEIILAADLYQVTLCGRSNDPIKTAETRLPANLCPLIKASYGHVLEDSCPYAFFSDIVVGETTCDGKKKMYELLGQLKPTEIIHLPNHPAYERSLEMWTMELRRFAKHIGERFNLEITDEKLNECIRWVNKERRQRARLYELGKLVPAAISGVQMHAITDGLQYMFNKQEKYDKMEETLNQCEENWKNGIYAYPDADKRPRIIVSGAGMAGVEDKTLKVIEEEGGIIVCYEGCCGITSMRRPVDEDESRDPYVRLAEKYLEVPCAVVSPNNKRMVQVMDTIDEWQADGLVSLTLHACNPFAIETENIRRVCEKKGVPVLHLVTDFSPGDEAQLRTRIGAFVEILREKKEGNA